MHFSLLLINQMRGESARHSGNKNCVGHVRHQHFFVEASVLVLSNGFNTLCSANHVFSICSVLNYRSAVDAGIVTK